MKKLYEVEIETHVYVMATSRSEAESKAQWEIDKDELDCDAHEVKAGDSIWCGWHDSNPYNSDNDKNVREILADMDKKQKQIDYEESHPKLPCFEIK